MTAAETGTTDSDIKSLATRHAVERLIFDLPADAPPADRPIYGYLEGSDETGDISTYGPIIVVTTPAVRQRCSVVLGDTNDDTLMAAVFAPVPVDAPSLDAVSPQRRGLPAARTLADACGQRRYAEVQIWGGLAVTEISRVIFSGQSRPPENLARALDDAAINWEPRP